MLEKIMEEIRDELRRSNDLKSKQLQDFTYTAEEPAGWTQLPEEPKEDEAPAKEEPKQEEAPAAAADAPDEATFKKAIAQIIKGGTSEQKSAVKEMIKDAGASKVSDVEPGKRQEIMDKIEAL